MLILGKPLGTGIYRAALKKDRLSPAHYAALVDSATRLNTPGIALARDERVHALTDVTGFGLLGHLLEMARASKVGATIAFDAVPLHPGVAALADDGCVTGASARNWSGYGDEVRLADTLPSHARALLTDPQTSGGLLVACAAEARDDVLARFRADGFARAAVIGTMTSDLTGVRVR